MNRIKQLRLLYGKQQKELALELGISQPTISDWESGRKVPSAKSTEMLARYFNVSIDYLLCRECVCGSRIKKRRIAQGYSDDEIASVISVPLSEYQEMEAERHPFSESQIIAIADFLCSSPDALTGYSWFPYDDDSIKAEKPALKPESELNDAFAKDFNRLTPEEQKMIHAQIKGLLSNRK